MKKMIKTVIISLIGVAAGIAVTQIGPPIIKFFGPPRVTLINVTGDNISDITISLGTVGRQIQYLNDLQTITVPVVGRFSACSTRISWTDSVGRHNESAGDYMENSGGYHTRIVLLPKRKAKAICPVTEEWLTKNSRTNKAREAR